MKKILIINGSIRGINGNSWRLSNSAQQKLKSYDGLKTEILNLSELNLTTNEVYKLLQTSDAFLVVTGTYWSNWGTPLQRFIEVATSWENSPAFFGKPMACVVTIDSVGGAEVAARLHAVFSGLGCWSPPCSSIILSRIGQEAIAASVDKADDPNEDVWRLDDVDVLLKNLVAATSVKNEWLSWPHVGLKTSEGKWPDKGDLDMGSPVFIES